MTQLAFSFLFYLVMVYGGVAVAEMTDKPALVGIVVGGLGVMVRMAILDVFEV